MRAGKLDRKITIQRRKVTGKHPSGEEIVDWQDVATVWAEKVHSPGNEVTGLRAVIRKVLMVADREGEAELAAAVRAVLTRDDDYATAGKPPCDWDDKAAREELVDALVRDCLAVLGVVDGRSLSTGLSEATELLALVAGQDVAEGDDGVFRIVRRVKPDRIISTVDTEARHGGCAQSVLRWLQSLMPVPALGLQCRGSSNAASLPCRSLPACS